MSESLGANKSSETPDEPSVASNGHQQPTLNIRQRFSNGVRAAPAVLLVGMWLVFGIKGCLVTTWSPPKEHKSYSIRGEDGRTMEFTFLPGRHALVAYGERATGNFEAELLKVKGGTYGTHYVGPLWNVSRGAESLFGIRWLAQGVEPVQCSIEVLDKIHHGFGDSAFSAVGTKHEVVWYFREGGFYFSGMWLNEAPHDAEMTDELIRLFEESSDRRQK